jgi:hypothetical protein
LTTTLSPSAVSFLATAWPMPGPDRLLLAERRPDLSPLQAPNEIVDAFHLKVPVMRGGKIPH